jgi:hypothetical protein
MTSSHPEHVCMTFIQCLYEKHIVLWKQRRYSSCIQKKNIFSLCSFVLLPMLLRTTHLLPGSLLCHQAWRTQKSSACWCSIGLLYKNLKSNWSQKELPSLSSAMVWKWVCHPYVGRLIPTVVMWQVVGPLIDGARWEVIWSLRALSL